MIIVRVLWADSSKKPVIGKEVTLFGSGISGKETCRTNSRGDAQFNLPRGHYDVHVGGKCYEKRALITDVLAVPWPF